HIQSGYHFIECSILVGCQRGPWFIFVDARNVFVLHSFGRRAELARHFGARPVLFSGERNLRLVFVDVRNVHKLGLLGFCGYFPAGDCFEDFVLGFGRGFGCFRHFGLLVFFGLLFVLFIIVLFGLFVWRQELLQRRARRR